MPAEHIRLTIRFDGMPAELHGEMSVRMDYWREASIEERVKTLAQIAHMMDGMARIAEESRAT